MVQPQDRENVRRTGVNLLEKAARGYLKMVGGKSIGSSSTSGWANSNYAKPSELELDKIKEVASDPTVKLALLVPTMIIRSRIRSYCHPDNEIQTFIRQNLARVQFRKIFRKMMQYRPIGASITEMVWRYNNGKIELSELVFLDSKTWFQNGLPKESKDPIKQSVKGLPVQIPQEKCVILKYQSEFGENGGIIDNTVYAHWESKYKNLRKWDSALDLFGAPGLIGWLKASGEIENLTGKNPKNSNKKNESATALATILAQWRSDKAAAFTDDIAVEKVQINNVGDNFLTKIAYDDKMICRSMLVPSLLIANDDATGSYATAKTHSNYFMMSLQSELDMISNELIDQMIRPLILMNWQTDDYGKFNLNDLDEKDYAMWMNIFTQLTAQGYLNPYNQMHVRKVLDFLDLLDDEINIMDPTEAQKNNQSMLNNTLTPADMLQDVAVV